MLTMMFRVPDYRTIYNMVIVSVFLLGVNMLISDYIERSEILDIRTVLW